MSMKNAIGTIGNRTRDLPACGAVPQLTGATDIEQYNKLAHKCTFVSLHLHIKFREN
jgi:hypothetical protein